MIIAGRILACVSAALTLYGYLNDNSFEWLTFLFLGIPGLLLLAIAGIVMSSVGTSRGRERTLDRVAMPVGILSITFWPGMLIGHVLGPFLNEKDIAQLTYGFENAYQFFRAVGATWIVWAPLSIGTILRNAWRMRSSGRQFRKSEWAAVLTLSASAYPVLAFSCMAVALPRIPDVSVPLII